MLSDTVFSIFAEKLDMIEEANVPILSLDLKYRVPCVLFASAAVEMHFVKSSGMTSSA